MPIVPLLGRDTGPTNKFFKERSEKMFYGGYDYQMVSQRMAEMRTEVERNRLHSRFAQEAHQPKDAATAAALSAEELSPPKGMAARSIAVVMALFR